MIKRITPFGNRVLLVEWEERIDPAINAQVHKLAADLKIANLDGVGELIPSYTSLAIPFDPKLIDVSNLIDWIAHWDPRQIIRVPGRRWFKIPVVYGDAYGPDFDFVCLTTGLSGEEVIALHSSTRYRVYLIGFLPGFPYLGILPEALRTNRKASPRSQVPAGSIGLAGAQTGIYPTDAPGGWQIIGRSPVPIFEPIAEHPFLLRAGDEISFYPITPQEWEQWTAIGTDNITALWTRLAQEVETIS